MAQTGLMGKSLERPPTNETPTGPRAAPRGGLRGGDQRQDEGPFHVRRHHDVHEPRAHQGVQIMGIPFLEGGGVGGLLHARYCREAAKLFLLKHLLENYTRRSFLFFSNAFLRDCIIFPPIFPQAHSRTPNLISALRADAMIASGFFFAHLIFETVLKTFFFSRLASFFH